MDNIQSTYYRRIYGVTSTEPIPYVYRITNIITGIHYYGKRLVNRLPPHFDLGSVYFSSSSEQEFMLDQKQNPQNYKYKIVRVFDDIKSAGIFETFLLRKFNVVSNDKFHNKNVGGFDTTGVAPAFTNQGYIGLISCNDPRWETGEIFGNSIGTACATTVDGASLGRVSIDDPRWEIGEIRSSSCGKSAAFLPDGTSLGAVSTDDPRWSTGEIVGSCYGTVSVKCTITGNSLGRVSINDPIYKSGKVQSIICGTAPAFLPDGTSLGVVSTDDPRWSTGEIVGSTHKKAAAFLPDGTSLGIVNTDDPRWSTGEIVGVGTNVTYITDGTTSKFYRTDGSDYIPEGWIIDDNLSNLRKGVYFLDVFNTQTGESYTNILARQFCKSRNLRATAFLACAYKNKNNTGKIHKSQGYIVRFSDIQINVIPSMPTINN